MRARDVLSYSFSAIKLRKLRAGLTTLGVVIGIAAIVALLSISQGLQSTITAQLERGFATDTLIVTAGGGGGFGMGGGLGGGGDSGFQLLVSDTQTINGLPNVDSSVAIIQRVVNNVSVGGTNKTGTVTGVDFAGYLDIYGDTFKASNGTIPIPPANDSIVVGKRVVDPRLNGTTIAGVNDPIGLTWINARARTLRLRSLGTLQLYSTRSDRSEWEDLQIQAFTFLLPKPKFCSRRTNAT